MENQAFLANPTIRSFRKKNIYPWNQSFSGTLGSKFGRINVWDFFIHLLGCTNPTIKITMFSASSAMIFLRETMIFLGQLPSNPQHSISFQATPVASSSMASRVRRSTPRAGRSPELVQLLGNIQYQWNFFRIMGFIWENLCRIWMESIWDMNGI